MTHTYNITGMTCNGCVAKAKSELLKLGDITEATVQLAAPQAIISMQKHIPVALLQQAINKAGNYIITEADNGMHHLDTTTKEPAGVAVYAPVLLLFAYVSGIAFLLQLNTRPFNLMVWMQHFMAGFFLSFSFFKIINLKGFASSYAMYDVIAKRWQGWGYVYAFIELGLGIAYAINMVPVVTNIITFAVMGISIIGVLQSVVNKRKIQCACLGAVFNLPMSSITIMEDLLMITMSATMLIMLL